MTLDDRLSQLVRDALEPMLAEQLEHLEERLVRRLAGDQSRPGPATSPAPLLTQKDVAAILRVAPRTVQRMVSADRFPAPISVGSGRPRWRRGDVEAWLDRRGEA